MAETAVRQAPSRILRRWIPLGIYERNTDAIDGALLAVDQLVHGDSEKAEALRSALTAFVIRVVSALIAFLSQALIARWMGSHEYGVFVFVWVAAVIMGTMACFGFGEAVVRFIPQYRQTGNLGALRGILLGSRFFVAISASVFAFLGVAGVYLFQDTITSTFVWPIYLGAVCLPMLALGEMQDGISRAFSWIKTALAPNFIIRPILTLTFLAIAVRMGWEASAEIGLIATIGAVWLTTLFQSILLHSRLKKVVLTAPRTYSYRTWFAVSLPVFLIEGFFNLLTNVDILIVGFYLEPDQVAIYFAAVKTLALVHFVYFAVKAASAPRISQYHASGDVLHYRSFVRDTVRWTFWPSLAAGVLLLLVGKYLLMLFGTDFAEGYPLLFILVIGIVVRSSIGPAESILTMSGEQNVCAAIYGAAFVINVVMNIALIPVLGLYGAALGTMTAMLFEALALWLVSKRKLGFDIFVLAKQEPSAVAGA